VYIPAAQNSTVVTGPKFVHGLVLHGLIAPFAVAKEVLYWPL
jgi:hypothetical protein